MFLGSNLKPRFYRLIPKEHGFIHGLKMVVFLRVDDLLQKSVARFNLRWNFFNKTSPNLGSYAGEKGENPNFAL
jgi:hypothetical protein